MQLDNELCNIVIGDLLIRVFSKDYLETCQGQISDRNFCWKLKIIRWKFRPKFYPMRCFRKEWFSWKSVADNHFRRIFNDFCHWPGDAPFSSSAHLHANMDTSVTGMKLVTYMINDLSDNHICCSLMNAKCSYIQFSHSCLYICACGSNNDK